jgi:hypothetical protein
MFPESQRFPSFRAQSSRIASVPEAIRQHLFLPVGPVIFWQPITTRTTVPETTIDEYRQTLAPEYEVRSAGKIHMSAPSRNSRFSENLQEGALGRSIAL